MIDEFYRGRYHQLAPMVVKNKKDINCWSVQFQLMIIDSGGVSFEQTMKLDQTGTNFGDDGTV